MRKCVFILCVIASVVGLTDRYGLTDEINAVALPERTTVFVREPFLFEIQVSGTENPEKPDMSSIKGASVRFRGGQQNSSSSVSIINGRMTKNVKKGYVFSYQIIPLKVGRLTIPSLVIKTDSTTVQTNLVVIQVKKPEETKDFKLRLSLSKSNCYVGEPVILTVTWYLAKDVRNFDFSLPFLESNDFYLADTEVDKKGTYIKIPLPGGGVQASRGQERLDEEMYTTISFKKVLIPKKSGSTKIGPAVVVCEALEGYRKRKSPFADRFGDDFFSDFFNRGTQGIYRKRVVESNILSLKVLDVPGEGKPHNFAGHIGTYRIYAQASPTEVNVGDPITLQVALSGPAYLDHITLPPLGEQEALSQDFKIPDERAAGKTVGGDKKVFTQTIRALRQSVNKIPAIELPYFDTETGQYRIAKTEPIPIHVRPTKIVTALDAEGAAGPEGTAGSLFRGHELKTLEGGIRYNYESHDSLEHQLYGPFSKLKQPFWLVMTVLPPIIYVSLLIFVTTKRHRRRNQDAVKAVKAYGKLKKKLRNAGTSREDFHGIVLDGVKSYLEDRLRIGHKVHTFNDVNEHLKAAGAGEDILVGLESFFTTCEQGRYAGGGIKGNEELPSEALTLVKLIENTLK
jgi:BatD DUF11 like domain